VGVGEDGHVASIFPCRVLPHVLVAPVYDAPKPPPRRLTLTLPVLANAERTIVAAVGASKSIAMRDALQHGDCPTPVAELLRRSRAPLVLLDRNAGSVLEAGRTP
jgi:6-phosphogluconolactonase